MPDWFARCHPFWWEAGAEFGVDVTRRVTQRVEGGRRSQRVVHDCKVSGSLVRSRRPNDWLSFKGRLEATQAVSGREPEGQDTVHLDGSASGRFPAELLIFLGPDGAAEWVFSVDDPGRSFPVGAVVEGEEGQRLESRQIPWYTGAYSTGVVPARPSQFRARWLEPDALIGRVSTDVRLSPGSLDWSIMKPTAPPAYRPIEIAPLLPFPQPNPPTRDPEPMRIAPNRTDTVESRSAAKLARILLAHPHVELTGSAAAELMSASDGDEIRTAPDHHSRAWWPAAEHAPAWLSADLLAVLVRVADSGRLRIARLVDGDHPPDSAHLRGTAADIDVIDGRRVADDADPAGLVRVARRLGAKVSMPDGERQPLHLHVEVGRSVDVASIAPGTLRA